MTIALVALACFIVFCISFSAMWPCNDVDPPMKRVIICGIIALFSLAGISVSVGYSVLEFVRSIW